MNLQNGDLRESITQGGKEMMAERWRDMLGRLGVREALDQTYQSYSRTLVTFSSPVSKSSLTYHSEFINEDSALETEENLLTAVVLYYPSEYYGI